MFIEIYPNMTILMTSIIEIMIRVTVFMMMILITKLIKSNSNYKDNGKKRMITVAITLVKMQSVMIKDDNDTDTNHEW